MAAYKTMQWSIDHPDKDLKGISYTEASIHQVGENEILFACSRPSIRGLLFIECSRFLVLIFLSLRCIYRFTTTDSLHQKEKEKDKQ